MATCSICRETYYRESFTDPGEKCLCGQGAGYTTPWQWDRWRGVRNAMRYRIASGLLYVANMLWMRRYR